MIFPYIRLLGWEPFETRGSCLNRGQKSRCANPLLAVPRGELVRRITRRSPGNDCVLNLTAAWAQHWR